MNKRTFFKSLLLGCAALGLNPVLNRTSPATDSRQRIVMINPDWVQADYELTCFSVPGGIVPVTRHRPSQSVDYVLTCVRKVHGKQAQWIDQAYPVRHHKDKWIAPVIIKYV